MKKLSFLFVFIYLTLNNLHAQDIILTFNAKDISNTIDSIRAINLETGETSFAEGSNTIHMSSFTTGTKLFPSNPEEISVYPNPFDNCTQLIFNSNQNDNIKVTVVNSSGLVVAEKRQNITSGIYRFNISTNNNGLYILNITGNKTKFSRKIISTRNNQSLNKIEFNGYSSISPKEKSAKIEEGELIHFYVYSGDNITKIADSPNESKTYEVEFYECKDYDGRNYPIVQIGEQWWMAENLAYNFEDSKESRNGMLYSWESAIEVCPPGWHIPSNDEFDALGEYISTQKGPYSKSDYNWDEVGKHLKSISGWNENGNGTDDFGFSALPNENTQRWGQWWSSSESLENNMHIRQLSYNNSKFLWNVNDKNLYNSVRCIKDSLNSAVSLMLNNLGNMITYFINYNNDLIANNPNLADLLQAKIDMLENTTLESDIINNSRFIADEVKSIDGRQIPIVAVFPMENMREEAAQTVLMIKSALQVLEEFMNTPSHYSDIKIWYGFKIGSTGGTSGIYTEDQGTYESRTGEDRLPFEAIIYHEMGHSYIGNESLNQFLEVYVYNLVNTSSFDMGDWIFKRGCEPMNENNQGICAILDIYQLLGLEKMSDAYKILESIRPPYGEPLSDEAKQAFIDQAPTELKNQVSEKADKI